MKFDTCLTRKCVIPNWQRVREITFRNVDTLNILENAKQLRLKTLYGSIDICAFEIKLGLIVALVAVE